MLAIDTNVVVRVLSGDHPEQSDIARKFVDANRVFVPKTVMLECEWVLRSTYELGSAEIANRLRAFAGLSTVKVEDANTVEQAIRLYEAGVDFADALHLQSSSDCLGFATFDQTFVKRARAQRTSPDVRLL